jgi:hypothetical protein
MNTQVGGVLLLRGVTREGAGSFRSGDTGGGEAAGPGPGAFSAAAVGGGKETSGRVDPAVIFMVDRTNDLRLLRES